MNDEQKTIVLLNEVDYYVEQGAPYVQATKRAAATDPTIVDIWLDPGTGRIIVRRDQKSSVRPKIGGLETVYESVWKTVPNSCWCGLVLSPAKRASVRENLQGITGWNDKYYAPSPLAAMLASGVLGAGLGYGSTAILAGLLPKEWDRKKLRRTGLFLGGTLAAAPGGLETMKSLLIGQPMTDGSHMRLKSAEFGGRPLPLSPRYSTGPIIDADAMLHTVWRNPMVTNRLTSKEKTLLTGAVTSTQQIAGSPYVTPSDMARLTAGMGIGYAAGLVAGKVIGTLTGMPTRTQKTLAETGMYAGAIKSVLPILFGLH